jgi:carboxyl-terminal processing protease
MKKMLMAAAIGTITGIGATTYVAGPLLADEASDRASVYEQLDLFGIIFERIRTQYVEEVDEGDLIEAAINGMLTSLDPHSSYLPPEAFTAMQVDNRGEFGGLGIEVTQESGFVKVITPMDDSPALAAGVEAGDFITAVDGETLLGLTLEEAVELMRGPVGSDILLTVRRENVEEPLEITVTRDIIKLTAARVRMESDTVVVRVSTFNEQTVPNVTDGMAREIEAAGGLDKITGVVLDLRNNPGGLLNAGVDLADVFLERGEIVSTRGRNPRDGDRFNARPGDLIEGLPMVVLINGGSASASEIVAGALQDHRRAVVVGTKSFGKGSVQSIMPVQGDGAMRLTTSRYYTPSGRSIQSLGVSPDIVVQQPPRVDPTEEAAERPRRSEAGLRGSISNDSLSEDEQKQILEEQEAAEKAAELRSSDYQLAYAVDILKGLNVIERAAR